MTSHLLVARCHASVQQATLTMNHKEISTSLAEEWKRNTGGRKKTGDHRYMDKSLPHDHERHTERNICEKPIAPCSVPIRSTETQNSKYGEKHHEDEYTHKTKLLGKRSENEITLYFRDTPQFIGAITKTFPQDPSTRDCTKRVLYLPVETCRIDCRKEKTYYAPDSVRLDKEKYNCRNTDTEREHSDIV